MKWTEEDRVGTRWESPSLDLCDYWWITRKRAQQVDASRSNVEGGICADQLKASVGGFEGLGNWKGWCSKDLRERLQMAKIDKKAKYHQGIQSKQKKLY